MILPLMANLIFLKAYTRDDERDLTYNYPRVWVIQQQFNPSLKQNVADGRQFAPMLTPEKKSISRRRQSDVTQPF